MEVTSESPPPRGGGGEIKKSTRQLRQENGIMQFDLAMQAGVSLVSISNWEQMKFRSMPMS